MATGGDADAQQYVRISDILKEPQKMLMPISGYEKEPLVPLEKAVEPLVSILPKIQDYVYIAKQRCDPEPADGLTQDESASIMVYSMEWEPHDKCLYFALNATLRAEDRRKLKPWFSYLKLILTALGRIPSTRRFLYRGVKVDLRKQHPVGKTFIWWGFSSCTLSMGVLENEQFLGKTGERTMFTIDCESGKDISRHSYFQSEKEILLLAARQFIVESVLEQGSGLHMIQLKETQSPISLLQSITSDSGSNKPAPSVEPKKKSEATAAPVTAKPVEKNFAASYVTKDPPTKAQKATMSIPKPKSQEFAAPGTFKEMYCKGRHCAKCGKCRDRYYTDDLESWRLVQNCHNWKDSDWKRYSNDRVENYSFAICSSMNEFIRKPLS